MSRGGALSLYAPVFCILISLTGKARVMFEKSSSGNFVIVG